MTKATIPHSKKSAKANRLTGNGSMETRSRRMLATMVAFRDGNFSVRLPSDWEGIDGQIAAAFNQALSHEDQLSREVERLSRIVGREGRLTQRMSVPGATGGGAAQTDCFNNLVHDLVRPTTENLRTNSGLAKRDLAPSKELEVEGR